MDMISVAEKVAGLSGAALLVIALIGAMRGWWVPRWLYDMETKKADYWKELYNRERLYNDNTRKSSRGLGHGQGQRGTTPLDGDISP